MEIRSKEVRARAKRPQETNDDSVTPDTTNKRPKPTHAANDGSSVTLEGYTQQLGSILCGIDAEISARKRELIDIRAEHDKAREGFQREKRAFEASLEQSRAELAFIARKQEGTQRQADEADERANQRLRLLVKIEAEIERSDVRHAANEVSNLGDRGLKHSDRLLAPLRSFGPERAEHMVENIALSSRAQHLGFTHRKDPMQRIHDLERKMVSPGNSSSPLIELQC